MTDINSLTKCTNCKHTAGIHGKLRCYFVSDTMCPCMCKEFTIVKRIHSGVKITEFDDGSVIF